MATKINNKEASDDQFNRAADLIGLDEKIRLSLNVPDRELVVEVPLRRDDGALKATAATEFSITIQEDLLRAVFDIAMRLI